MTGSSSVESGDCRVGLRPPRNDLVGWGAWAMDEVVMMDQATVPCIDQGPVRVMRTLAKRPVQSCSPTSTHQRNFCPKFKRSKDRFMGRF